MAQVMSGDLKTKCYVELVEDHFPHTMGNFIVPFKIDGLWSMGKRGDGTPDLGIGDLVSTTGQQ